MKRPVWRETRVERVEGRPEYLRMTAPRYRTGWVYKRLANAAPMLAPFQMLLIAVLCRPQAQRGPDYTGCQNKVAGAQ
jgi:hypothetical protein